VLIVEIDIDPQGTTNDYIDDPENKFVAWPEAIRKMIKDGASTAKEIKANIGRLIHLGLAIPFVHYFMSRLRDLHSTVKRSRSIKINYECLKDLETFLGFLKIASDGISINSIAFRRPTHIYRSDSCLTGLGGYRDRGWAGDGIYQKTFASVL
jgi:hypothetical protein